jgi:hypothetical protein
MIFPKNLKYNYRSLCSNMPNALVRQSNDLGVYSVPPQTPTDPRVRLAEEDSLQSLISAYQMSLARTAEWVQTPEFTIGDDRLLGIKGQYRSRFYPSDFITLNSSLTIPPLTTKEEVVKRVDTLSLVVFGAIAGQEHDPAIGEISFDYFSDEIPAQLKAENKENARRIRSFYCFVLSTTPLTKESFLESCVLSRVPVGGESRLNGDREISFVTNAAGSAFGNARLYGLDPKLVADVPYPIVNDFLEIVDIASIDRVQNLEEDGYIWGFRGEEPLNLDYSIRSLIQSIETDKTTLLQTGLNRLFSGSGYPRKKAVLNLIAGTVVGNLGRPGRPASSPNGSFCVANGQRISFLNGVVLQNEAARVLTASTDGSGNALLTIGLDTNVPSDTFFSESISDHRVFDQYGSDQTNFGTFLNLGQSGALIWQATSNSTIKPGQRAYFSAAVRYPPGSGFDIPFNKVDFVWMGGVPLNAANIRMGFRNDLTQYESPVSGDFIIVFDTGRAGILYILKRVSITTSALGVATIPESAKGNFAWIQGVSDRVDAPIKSGLQANASYEALVYHVPTAIENWQIQVSYSDYQGLGDQSAAFINGSVVVSNPVLIATTQGGGSSVFVSDASIRHSAIGMHLPIVDSEIDIYALDAPIRLPDEQNPGSLTTRMINPIPGLNVMPTPGTVLRYSQNPGIGSGRNINGMVKNRDGDLLGFRSNILHSKAFYLAVFAVLIRKDGVNRILIATKTTKGGEEISFDSASSIAFDLFEV